METQVMSEDWDRKEYNEFGPWIVEIQDERMLPRLFRKTYREESCPLLLIKIPRRTERRLASVKMDLYDYVVGAFNDYLYILKRNDKTVTEQKVLYNDIVAIKRTHALLKGELFLYTKDGVVQVIYNTVSDEIVLRLVQIIQKGRNHFNEKQIDFESIPVEYIPGDAGSIDLYDVNLSERLMRLNPNLRLAAYQARIAVDKKTSMPILKFKKRIMVQNAYLSDGKELVVICRNITKRNKAVDNLAYDYLFLPIQHIMDVNVYDFNPQHKLKKMELITIKHHFELIFESGNEQLLRLASSVKAALY